MPDHTIKIGEFSWDLAKRGKECRYIHLGMLFGVSYGVKVYRTLKEASEARRRQQTFHDRYQAAPMAGTTVRVQIDNRYMKRFGYLTEHAWVVGLNFLEHEQEIINFRIRMWHKYGLMKIDPHPDNVGFVASLPGKIVLLDFGNLSHSESGYS